jgi:hypothetical protein
MKTIVVWMMMVSTISNTNLNFMGPYLTEQDCKIAGTGIEEKGWDKYFVTRNPRELFEINCIQSRIAVPK